jgi:hypothetical protein
MVKVVASRFNRKGRLWRLLYGDDEGTFRFRKGMLSYSFEADEFELRDNEGVVRHRTDLGEDVERWLVREEWTGA